MSTEKTKNSEFEKVFVVIRNGFRVSNSEYETPEEAHHEHNYWNSLLTRWPDGSRLEIREINRKRKVELA